MTTVSVSAKVTPNLRKEIESIAQLENRSVSTVVRMAVEYYIKQYDSLHPQFRADILEALEAVKMGETEPYARG